MQNILNQGLDLMVIGMGTVFFFLTLLVVATTLMSKVIIGFGRGRQSLASEAKELHQDIDEQELIAVITSAIRQHRARTK